MVICFHGNFIPLFKGIGSDIPLTSGDVCLTPYETNFIYAYVTDYFELICLWFFLRAIKE